MLPFFVLKNPLLDQGGMAERSEAGWFNFNPTTPNPSLSKEGKTCSTHKPQPQINLIIIQV